MRVIIHPVAAHYDYKRELEKVASFPDFVSRIQSDWYKNAQEFGEEAIDGALSVVQAQFSHADLERRTPMWDIIDPEDVAFNLDIGLPGNYGLGIESRIAEDMDYELHLTLLTYEELAGTYLPYAEGSGHCASIPHKELQRAKIALDEARLAIMKGNLDFRTLPDLPTMVMNSADIHKDCSQSRDDIALNSIFSQTLIEARAAQPAQFNPDRRKPSPKP